MTSGSQRDTTRPELGVLLDTTYLYRLMASDALFSLSERHYLEERGASAFVVHAGGARYPVVQCVEGISVRELAQALRARA